MLYTTMIPNGSSSTSSESSSLLSRKGYGQSNENGQRKRPSASSFREVIPACEEKFLLGRSRETRWRVAVIMVTTCLVMMISIVSLKNENMFSLFSQRSSFARQADFLPEESWNNVLLVGSGQKEDEKISHAIHTTNSSFSYKNVTLKHPIVESRCQWVMQQFHDRDVGSDPSKLRSLYRKQSVDANVYYRATAHIFWNDFVHGNWGEGLAKSWKQNATLQGNVPLDPKSTFTWVTGDQHLSNFGAFRNRHGDIVFGVNDFDEAAIFDFQIDVLRIAVSVYNQALTNGLNLKNMEKTLKKFTDTYVKTIINYIGNEDALLFELTTKTTKGFLKNFLNGVRSDGSYEKQMDKYTNLDTATGYRDFQKGPVGQPDPYTKLEALPPERVGQIRSVFTATTYGATMMKLGWAVREWNDDFFTVLDVAARIGSGVGSSGVDRYYVLLKGTDELLENTNTKKGRTAVVLDMKYEPPGAVWQALTPTDKAWYQIMFPNAAARTVEAQRRLTSFTDPYNGWAVLPDTNGVLQPFSVRQRGPWKDSPDLEKMNDPYIFTEFMEQIAAATATSHVRGSVGKAPGDFKHVIQALLGKEINRREWGKAVARLAWKYHKQVLLDYRCFYDYVQKHYPEHETTTTTTTRKREGS